MFETIEEGELKEHQTSDKIAIILNFYQTGVSLSRRNNVLTSDRSLAMLYTFLTFVFLLFNLF